MGSWYISGAFWAGGNTAAFKVWFAWFGDGKNSASKSRQSFAILPVRSFLGLDWILRSQIQENKTDLNRKNVRKRCWAEQFSLTSISPVETAWAVFALKSWILLFWNTPGAGHHASRQPTALFASTTYVLRNHQLFVVQIQTNRDLGKMTMQALICPSRSPPGGWEKLASSHRLRLHFINVKFLSVIK